MSYIKEANSPVAENIKLRIEANGLKKKTIAAKAGLTQNELTDIFGGRRIVKAREILALAEAMEAPVGALFEPAQHNG